MRAGAGAASSPSAATTRQPRRILLVEDEESLVLTLVDRLRSEGYEVDAAGDGHAVLERALAGSYDLVLLDVGLPRCGGFEHVWGYPAAVQTRTVDVHVASLRQKVEPQPSRPQHVVTVHHGLSAQGLTRPGAQGSRRERRARWPAGSALPS